MANAIRWGFIAALAASFVVFLTLILTVFDLSGTSFILSIAFLLGMMVFFAVSMGGAYRNKRWGWLFVMFSCLIIMLFAYVAYIIEGVMPYHTVLLASSIILFAIALVNIGLADSSNEREEKQSAPPVKVYQSMEKVEPYYGDQTSATVAIAPSKKKASKGKFVASKMATHYHTPRCEWTPNIKRRNRIWFASEASAKRAKFKPHECVTGRK